MEIDLFEDFVTFGYASEQHLLLIQERQLPQGYLELTRICMFALVGLADPAYFTMFELLTLGLELWSEDGDSSVASLVYDVSALDVGTLYDAVDEGPALAVGLVVLGEALAEFDEVGATLGANTDLELKDHVPRAFPNAHLEPALLEVGVLLDGLVQETLQLADEEVVQPLLLAELVLLRQEQHLHLLHAAQLLAVLQHHYLLAVH